MNFWKIREILSSSLQTIFRGENITAVKQMQTTCTGCIFYKTKEECLLNFYRVETNFEICVERFKIAGQKWKKLKVELKAQF